MYIPPVSAAVWLDECALPGMLNIYTCLTRYNGVFCTFIVNEFTLRMQCSHRLLKKMLFRVSLKLDGWLYQAGKKSVLRGSILHYEGITCCFNDSQAGLENIFFQCNFI